MSWIEVNKAKQKTFRFTTQTELAEFVLKVAKVSDQLDHHANMQVTECNKLMLEITTHDSNNELTEKDSEWINKIDAIS